MSTIDLLIAAGGITASLALLYFALLGGPSSRKAAERRLQQLVSRHSDNSSGVVEIQLRKAIAARQKRPFSLGGADSRLDALALRLDRTGTTWTLMGYLYVSAGLFVTIAGVLIWRTGWIPLALFAGLLFGVGLPHFVVGKKIAKRQKQFVMRFPDAIELMVRGLRSGLPVTETLGVIAEEVPGPVGVEFKGVIERIKIGRTMDEALQDTADRLDLPEFNFFIITLAIQRETGGNLAETLSNLAEVLRSRSQMKLKIKAMSSESKASAYIVGSLPFIVFTLVWWMNPDYVGAFFVDERLIVVGLGGLVWLGLGAFIMSRMVNFEI